MDKTFFPRSMAESPFGEVIFQADYALKKICFGDVHQKSLDDHQDGSKELRFESLIDVLDTHHEDESGTRQWFKLTNASVVRTADSVLVPEVTVEVCAMHFVPHPEENISGYVKALHLMDEDAPAQKHATDMTNHMVAIMQVSPEIRELKEVARAVVLAKYLISDQGFQPSEAATQFVPRSVLPEINRMRHEAASDLPPLTKYPLRVNTLRKLAKVTNADHVQTEREGETDEQTTGVRLYTVSQTVFGGVDLSISDIKVETVEDIVRDGRCHKYPYPALV
ncbi:unnamed protein product [Amoebophrya sp. A25]|nr:unnamed protein product [Amoebophrya sp. A25]|eukprot:GSA25T00009747001.1